MGRKSGITRLPGDVRDHIDRHLRENRLTLDELVQEIHEAFPDLEAAPSRSALGRYRMGFEEVMKNQRAIEATSSALVAELGENFDEKSGALLAQAVTTLATRTAFGQLEKTEVEIADVLDLARAAKVAQEARSLNLKERQTVARLAREKLLEEQQKRAAEVEKKPGVSAETMVAIRQVLGIV